MPSASNAALWMTGDRLCTTGQPGAATPRGPPPIRGSATEALLHVLQMLLVRDGEAVTTRTVGRTCDVIEVFRVRGGQRRLQRFLPRARDGRGRQPRVDPCVVRRIGL